MTISDAISPLWGSGLPAAATGQGAAAPKGLLGAEAVIEFRLGPEHAPIQSMRRARGFVAKVLPSLLRGAPEAKTLAEAVLAVLTELVDVTARHRIGIDLSGRVSYDGDHVLVTVGEMGRRLPASEEEPGLYIVHRVADEVGQYLGDEGGYMTWVSVPVRPRAN